MSKHLFGPVQRRTAIVWAVGVGVGLGSGAAQAQRYQRYIGAPADERPANIERTTDDGFIITGAREGGPIPFQFSSFVTRTDALGIVRWTRQFAEPLAPGSSISGLAVRELANGDFIVGARRDVPGSLDMTLHRVNSAGVPIWNAAYLAGPVDGRLAVREVSNGDIVAVTQRPDNVPGGVLPGGVFIRTTSAGVVTAQRTIYNGTVPQRFGAMFLTDVRERSGQFLAVGGTELVTPAPGGFTIAPAWTLVAFSATGNVLSAVAYRAATPGFGIQWATGMELLANGDIMIVGNAINPATNQEVLLALRCTPAGVPIWSRQFSLTTARGFTSKNVREAPNGDLVIGCNYEGPLIPTGPAVILRLNAAGNPVLVGTYGPLVPAPGQAATNAALVGATGNVPAIAVSKPSPPLQGLGGLDIQLVRTDGVGTQCFSGQVNAQVANVPFSFQTIQIAASDVTDRTTLNPPTASNAFGQDSVCCPGDVNGDGVVNFNDLNAVLSGFGGAYAFATLNNVLGGFGAVCAP